MYSWWWVELSPETCRVKPLKRINAIVASCWIYFTIYHHYTGWNMLWKRVLVKTIMTLLVPRRCYQLLGTDSVAWGDVTVPYVNEYFQSFKLNFSLERHYFFHFFLCPWFLASKVYINKCPTRCNNMQSIFYFTAISLHMFRVPSALIIRST